jgi:hypothetical protein
MLRKGEAFGTTNSNIIDILITRATTLGKNFVIGPEETRLFSNKYAVHF